MRIRNMDPKLLDTMFAHENTNPETFLSKENMRASVRLALQKLPSKEKTVMILHYYEDMLLEDIGFVLGYTKEVVIKLNKSALRRIRQSLRRIL